MPFHVLYKSSNASFLHSCPVLMWKTHSFPTHFLLLPPTVLLKFRTDKGRDPQPDSFAEDSHLLLQIRDDVLETMGLSSELLPNTFVRYLLTQKLDVHVNFLNFIFLPTEDMEI